MSAYKGRHKPLPDGRCEHRWANRVTRIVVCAASLNVERLTAALKTLGYPPLHMVHGTQGPSAHFERDNAAFAQLIWDAYAAVAEPPSR